MEKAAVVFMGEGSVGPIAAPSVGARSWLRETRGLPFV
jgi:hypothetical protein